MTPEQIQKVRTLAGGRLGVWNSGRRFIGHLAWQAATHPDKPLTLN